MPIFLSLHSFLGEICETNYCEFVAPNIPHLKVSTQACSPLYSWELWKDLGQHQAGVCEVGIWKAWAPGVGRPSTWETQKCVEEIGSGQWGTHSLCSTDRVLRTDRGQPECASRKHPPRVSTSVSSHGSTGYRPHLRSLPWVHQSAPPLGRTARILDPYLCAVLPLEITQNLVSWFLKTYVWLSFLVLLFIV